MNRYSLLSLPLLASLLTACGAGPGGQECTPTNFQGCTAQCDQGNGGACNTLGDMYRTGLATDKDPAKAAASYAKACDLGSADGCFSSYAALANGVGVPRDVEAALLQAEKGCRLGESKSCKIAEIANQMKALARPID